MTVGRVGGWRRDGGKCGDGGEEGTEKARGGGEQVGGGAGGQQGAGEWFGGEAIEGHIGIDGIDDPIAVFPDRACCIDCEAIRVGVASEVEPVSAPAFAVARRGEQSVDESRVGLRASVGQECVDLLDRGGQSEQVEAASSDQGDSVGFARGGQLFVVESCEHEGVDGVANPCRVADVGQFGADDWLKRPVIAAASCIDDGFVGG